ncbi:hypothetical protein [Streptomyces sp. NPDC005423]|uniref:hypothetical protein n=1 Tax=Streptomyces sp. NPDC005423 TaxID=3155343 RepID=UPI00339DE4C6
MAEHGSDREDREPDEKGVPFDEEAAWAAIVAGYGDEPQDPAGAKPFKSVEDLALLDPETNGGTDDGTNTETNGGTNSERHEQPEARTDEPANPVRPLGSSVFFAPGVGPRDAAAPAGPHADADAEDDDEDDDGGHFVPPEPPPLPSADATATFAWLAVIGGPVLLVLAVLFGWDMTWWLSTLSIGGFLGGFATLVTRMRTDDEEGDDPGRGAVV